MLVVEKLRVVLLGEDSPAVRHRVHVDKALGAAVVADLALCGAVEYDAASVSLRVPAGTPAPDDPVLAEAFALVADGPRPISLVIGRLRHVESAVEERLATAATESAYDPLAEVLTAGQDPDPATAALVTLLSYFEQADRVVDHPGLTNRAVAERARRVADSAWSTESVRTVVHVAGAVATSTDWANAVDRAAARV